MHLQLKFCTTFIFFSFCIFKWGHVNADINRPDIQLVNSRLKRDDKAVVKPASPDIPDHGAGAVSGSGPAKTKDSKVNSSLPSNTNDTSWKQDDYTTSIQQLYENKGMLLRTLYVSLGVTGIVIVYFVIRAVRLRRRRSKSRKYGIIAQRDRGDVEMEPLGDGADDDDDDYTVFEMNGRK